MVLGMGCTFMEFFKKYTNCMLWLVTVVITIVAGIWLCRNGTSVAWTEAGPEGGPGGNPYVWKPYMFIIILAMVVVSGIGLYLRKVLSKQPALKGYWGWSFVDALLSNPMTTVPWAIFLCAWLVLFDVFDLLPNEVPPLGRMIQMAVEEIGEGRLFQAVLTTGSRNGLVLLIACVVSILLILFLGENRKLCQSCIPHMRGLALVPPVILFTYGSYLDSLFHSRGWWEEWLIHCGGGQVNVLSMAFCHPGRLLLLCSVAIWPLLIIGLDQYHKISDTLNNEIKKYRLPWKKAVLSVKLRYIIKAISPVFYIAIVLVFVVCVDAETDGSTQTAIDGVATFYMDQGILSARDRVVFGVCLLTFLGLFFMGVCDLIASYMSGLRHIQFEGESTKRNKRRLL